jgi:endonuclease/exonuclease/phosphatase family metal-dependent hydrolase
MPQYKALFDTFRARRDKESARRAAAQLLKLRRQLTRTLPARTVDETLLLATWNLREFGSGRMYGARLDESIQYIAEIVSRFDLVAVQEVRRNLGDLVRLMRVLGDWWDYMVTDVSEGRSGNEERIAFLYDRRKVRFDHLAGEITLPAAKTPVWQLARSPFLCSFRSGWRRFAVCSVHIYYGTDKPDDPRRVEEIDKLAKLLAVRSAKREKQGDGEPENVILLGDFNIFHHEGGLTMKALHENGFVIPKDVAELEAGSNLAQDKYFDQIAFLDPKKLLRSTRRTSRRPPEEKYKKGVFRFTESIFGAGDAAVWKREIAETMGTRVPAKKLASVYRQWRTFQISDHFPLWIELKMDFADGFIATCGGLTRKKVNDGRTGR